MVDPDGAQRVEPVGAACGRQHRRAAGLGQDGGDHAHGRGAAADQQRLPGLQVQADVQGPVRGLQHLRHGAERGPRQLGPERDHVGGRHARVLGVAAVELAAHPAHHRHHLLAGGELAARRLDDHAGGLDPRHARERDPLGEAEARVQLRAVQAERLDLDQHPAGLRQPGWAVPGSARPRAGPGRRVRRRAWPRIIAHVRGSLDVRRTPPPTRLRGGGGGGARGPGRQAAVHQPARAVTPDAAARARGRRAAADPHAAGCRADGDRHRAAGPRARRARGGGGRAGGRAAGGSARAADARAAARRQAGPLVRPGPGVHAAVPGGRGPSADRADRGAAGPGAGR